MENKEPRLGCSFTLAQLLENDNFGGLMVVDLSTFGTQKSNDRLTLANHHWLKSKRRWNRTFILGIKRSNWTLKKTSGCSCARLIFNPVPSLSSKWRTNSAPPSLHVSLVNELCSPLSQRRSLLVLEWSFWCWPGVLRAQPPIPPQGNNPWLHCIAWSPPLGLLHLVHQERWEIPRRRLRSKWQTTAVTWCLPCKYSYLFRLFQVSPIQLRLP